MAFAAISLGPVAFPFLSVKIALLISVVDSLSQSIRSYVADGFMPSRVSGVGLFNSTPKCSPSKVFSVVVSLSLGEGFHFFLPWFVCLLELVGELNWPGCQCDLIYLSLCFS